MVQGGLKKVQGGLEPPLAPHFPRLWLIKCVGNSGLLVLNKYEVKVYFAPDGICFDY